MLEIVKSLITVLIMVPVMIGILLGVIYGLGEMFNWISFIGKKNH